MLAQGDPCGIMSEGEKFVLIAEKVCRSQFFVGNDPNKCKIVTMSFSTAEIFFEEK